MPHDPYQSPRAPLETPGSFEERDRGIAKRYLIGAIAIGIMQVVDAVILFKNDGTLGSTSLVLSAVEFIWVIVSVFALILAAHGATRLLSLCYLGYNITGWVVGAFLVPSETMSLPIWSVVFGGVFGMAYAFASAFVAKGVMGRRDAA